MTSDKKYGLLRIGLTGMKSPVVKIGEDILIQVKRKNGSIGLYIKAPKEIRIERLNIEEIVK